MQLYYQIEVMRLYLDNNYQPGIYKIINQLHNLQSPKNYEVIYRDWKEEYTSNDTVVFLINFSKRAIDTTALDYYEDGYKVFIYRKPYDKAFDPYLQALIIMAHWKKIIKTVEESKNGGIYSINDYRLEKLK